MNASPSGKERLPIRLRSTLIARDSEGRFLLLRHVRPQGTFWVLPGGGVDFGETVEGALVREVSEELGVECEVDRLVAIGELIQSRRHVVDLFFLGSLSSTGPFRIRKEEGISDAGWFDPSEFDRVLILPPEIFPVLRGLDEVGKTGIVYLGEYKSEGRKIALDWV